jgi:hypothetical protein
MTTNPCENFSNVAQPPLAEPPVRASKRNTTTGNTGAVEVLDREFSHAPNIFAASQGTDDDDEESSGGQELPDRRIGQKRARSKPEMAAEALQRYIHRQSSYSLPESNSLPEAHGNELSRQKSHELSNPNEEWDDISTSQDAGRELLGGETVPASECSSSAALFLQMLNERRTLIKDLKTILGDESDDSDDSRSR